MPTPILTAEQGEALESLIDRASVQSVLYAIAVICREKAQHIQENWQDSTTAGCWRFTAAHVEKAAKKAEV